MTRYNLDFPTDNIVWAFMSSRSAMLDRAPSKTTIPFVNTTQRVAFSILCAKQVCRNKKWNIWADRWLKNQGRVRETQEWLPCFQALVVLIRVCFCLHDNGAAAFATQSAIHAYTDEDMADYKSRRAAERTNWASREARFIDFVAITKEAMKYS